MRLLLHDLLHVFVVFQRLYLRIAHQAGVVAVLDGLGDFGIGATKAVGQNADLAAVFAEDNQNIPTLGVMSDR